ncbi:MAG: hypothetical protein ACOY4H_12660 [Thermodesulfobacteriota bacterium]
MKKNIVFILSTSYAGSHYLSLMLGSNSRALHIGEVKRLRKQEQDNAGTQYSPLNNDGTNPMLKGFCPQQINEIYDVIFSNIDPAITTLIDTSKKPFWAERFLDNPCYTYRFIHLIRDPRPYVRRMMLRYRTAGDRLRIRKQMIRDFLAYAPRFLFKADTEVYAYRWLKQNVDITDFLRKNRLEYELVTYFDLAHNTSSELQRLTEAMGLTFEPGQIEYWNFEHHGTQKIEYQWIGQKKETNYFDMRWKEFLSPTVQQQIFANPDINAYLDSLAIRYHDRGLSRTEK